MSNRFYIQQLDAIGNYMNTKVTMMIVAIFMCVGLSFFADAHRYRYPRSGFGVGVGLGPFGWIGAGVYDGYDWDDCFYDEFDRLVCYAPW